MKVARDESAIRTWRNIPALPGPHRYAKRCGRGNTPALRVAGFDDEAPCEGKLGNPVIEALASK
jgi:hypothetical protein